MYRSKKEEADLWGTEISGWYVDCADAKSTLNWAMRVRLLLSSSFQWISSSELHKSTQSLPLVCCSHDILPSTWRVHERHRAFDSALWLPVPGRGRRDCPFPALSTQPAWAQSWLDGTGRKSNLFLLCLLKVKICSLIKLWRCAPNVCSDATSFQTCSPDWQPGHQAGVYHD